MKSRYILLLYIVLLCQPAMAGNEKAMENTVFTLERSIEFALEKNWELRSKEEKVNQALEVKKQARSEFLPKLSMSYGYTRLSEVPSFRASVPFSQRIRVGTVNNFQWRGTITQPLFTGFSIISNYELSKLGIDQAKLEVDIGRLDLALRVKEAYFGILEAQKGVEVAQKAVESLRSHVNVAKHFFDVGIIPVNDLLKAEVELANAEHNLIKAKNALKLAKSAFNVILARPIDAPVAVKDILVYKPEKGSLDKYLGIAIAKRPEIKLLDTHIKQTDAQIDLARSRNYPEVVFTYDYIKEGDNPDVSGSQFHDAGRWQAVAALSWTFWEWGKTHHTIKEKRLLRKELLEMKNAVIDRVKLEVKEAVLNLEAAAANIPTTKKAVEQAEENLRVNKERYKVQVGTTTDVLDAQTLLTQARTNYYRALYDHNLAKARLLRALGTY